MPRDRRWDFLYDRQRQPVKAFVLERLAEELARELEAARPPDAVLRAALEAGRRDLARDWDGAEARLGELPEGDRGAGRALARELVEACLDLKERAEGLALSRPELARALAALERRLFRVTG